jgi:hypothetical protein
MRRRDEHTCELCGEEIPRTQVVCPFCEHRQSGAPTPRPHTAGLVTVNLKEGLPTLAEASARLDRELEAARRARVQVVKLIHGYGSSGVGGKLRHGLRARLADMERRGTIRGFFPGEEFDKRGRAKPWLGQVPLLRNDADYGRSNPGVTLVIV